MHLRMDLRTVPILHWLLNDQQKQKADLNHLRYFKRYGKCLQGQIKSLNN